MLFRSVPSHDNLFRSLVQSAREKLKGKPVQIPQYEHRELHLCIFRRLDNPFVLGILEAYWEVYENVGLNVLTDLNYLELVWQYHEKMVEAIISGNFAVGYQALVDHMALLLQRPKPLPRQNFE